MPSREGEGPSLRGAKVKGLMVVVVDEVMGAAVVGEADVMVGEDVEDQAGGEAGKVRVRASIDSIHTWFVRVCMHGSTVLRWHPTASALRCSRGCTMRRLGTFLLQL